MTSKTTFRSSISHFYILFFIAFIFSWQTTTSQTLIADYGLGQSSLNDATGNYADILIGANATTNTVSSCSDALSNWNTGIKTPSLITLNRSSFQFDVTINITSLPTGTNKHNILTFDQSYRDFGLAIDSQGFLYIYYHNGLTSSSSTNTFIAGTDYDIKIQYINGDAKLMVNNSIEIEATLPNPLQGAAANLDNSIFLGDNPGDVYFVEACYSNLKVYSSPIPLLSSGSNEMQLDLKLYPNPTQDYIIILSPVSLKVSKVTLFDLTGRLMKVVNFPNTTNSTRVKVDLQQLPIATYMMQIEADNGTKAYKMIVKK